MSNQVIKTTNTIITEVDQSSFKKAMAQIKKLNKERGSVKAVGESLRRSGGVYRRGSDNFRRSYNNPVVKQKREEIAAERKLNQIRAKGIRFATANSNLNLTGAQRAQAISDFSALTKQYHSGGMALAEYNARYSQLMNNMRKTGKVGVRGSYLPTTAKVTKVDTSMLDQMKGVLTVGATIGMGVSIMQTGQDFQSMEKGLLAITGDASSAAKEMQYLRDQSFRLGLDLQKTSKDYVKFMAAASGKASDSQIKELFEGVSEYSVVLGASAEEQSRALLALNQMYSKGKVGAEELRQQLGDALPNSVGIFVKALNEMKGTTDLTDKDLFELMEQGKLFAKDILPLVGKQFRLAAANGGALEVALKNNRVAMQRMITASQEAQNKFFKSGFGDALTRGFNTATIALESMGPAFEKVGAFAGGIVDGFNEAFEAIYNFGLGASLVLEHFGNSLGLTDTQIKDFAGDAGKWLGIFIAAKGIFKLAAGVKFLISFLTPLKQMLGALQGINNLGGVTTGGVGAKAGKGGKGGFLAGSSAMGKTGVIGLLMMLQDMVASPVENAYPNLLGKENPLAKGLNTLPGSDAVAEAGENFRGWWKQWVSPAPTGQSNPDISYPFKSPQMNLTTGINVPGTSSPVKPNQVTVTLDQKELLIKSEVQVNDGAVAGLVESMLKDQDMRTLNMLLSSTAGSAG